MTTTEIVTGIDGVTATPMTTIGMTDPTIVIAGGDTILIVPTIGMIEAVSPSVHSGTAHRGERETARRASSVRRIVEAAVRLLVR